MSTPRPAKGAPETVVLEGRYTRLEPLRPQHASELFRAASPARYRYLSGEAPATEAEAEAWIASAISAPDPLYFAVIDRNTGRCEGRQGLMAIMPQHGSIEVGGVLWGDRIARTRVATEALFLHARYVFGELGYRRFEWKCNALNQPSQDAARRFGFTYEGTFRQHMIVKGENRDTAWFSMLDGEWPRIRAEFERWLSPQNFDAEGVQLSRLSAAPTD